MTDHTLPLDDGSEPDWEALRARITTTALPDFDPPTLAEEDAMRARGELPPLRPRVLMGGVPTFSAEEQTRWQEQDDDEAQSRLDEQQWWEDQGQ